MPATALLSEEEYLRTSFPDVDRDFHDGEIAERSMPDLYHSLVTANLIFWFMSRKSQCGFVTANELRLLVARGQYRVVDVCVFWPEAPSQSIPEFPPLIAIEVLSPDDRYTEVRRKLAEYRDAGVKHVWLVDPIARTLSVFDGKLHEVDSFSIPEAGLTLERAAIFP